MVELYRRFRAPLNSYFQRRMVLATDAEDLTQEVFLRLAKHQDRLVFDSIEALVFTIAANLLRDRRRRQTTRGAAALSIEQDMADSAEPNLVEAIDPERLLIGKTTLDRAVAALSELTPRTREIFVLCRVEGLKYRDVAAALGISVSAVEKHMVKALTHIARRLAR